MLANFGDHTILSNLGLSNLVKFTPVNKKKPYLTNWQTASQSLDFCLKEIKTGKADGFGLVTGNGLLAIDFDRENSFNIAKAIGLWLIETDTLSWTSGKAHSLQKLFKIPDNRLKDFVKFNRKSINKYGNIAFVQSEQLELRYNHSQSVLPPSKHPETDCYTWLFTDSIHELNDYQCDCLLNIIYPQKQQSNQTTIAYNHDELDKIIEAINHIDCDCDYDTWSKIGMALFSYFNGSNEGLNVWANWSCTGSKFKGIDELEYKWSNFKKEGINEIKINTLFFIAKDYGYNPKSTPKSDKCSTVTSTKINNNSNNLNIKNNDKKINVKVDSIDEVRNILVNEYAERLKYNELKRIVELDGEEAYLDDLYLQIHEYYGIKISKQIAYDLAVMSAKKNSYHPVKDYLNNLKENSHEIDIKNLSSLLFGTTNKLYDEMVYRHLIGSVARVFIHGCKLDTALILQGKQGIGKSTFFKDLYGSEFFTDSVAGTDRDNLLILHQNWCSELAEFETITGKKASGELKAFLSKSVDTFREPYGRSTRTIKRQCVIVGSVNESEFLVDTTGNRRFWVIPIDQPINLEAVKKYRDVIWYQAKKAFLENENWYLNYKYQKESEDLNKQYLHTDSWDSQQLNNFLTGFEELGIAVRDILIKHLGFSESQIKRNDEQRIAKILTSKGYIKKQKKINGQNIKLWFFTRFEEKIATLATLATSQQNQPLQGSQLGSQLKEIATLENDQENDQNDKVANSDSEVANSNDVVSYLQNPYGSNKVAKVSKVANYFSKVENFEEKQENNKITEVANFEKNLEKSDSKKNQSNLNQLQTDEIKTENLEEESKKYRKALFHEFKVNKITENSEILNYIHEGLNNNHIISFNDLSVDNCCFLINKLRGIVNIIE